MITLQSGKRDKIIITDTIPTPEDPEEIVGNINVTWYAFDGFYIDEKRIFIKRNMLGTSIEVFTDAVLSSPINDFSVIPTTIQITQTGYDVLSIQIPIEVLEEDIELIVVLDYELNP